MTESWICHRWLTPSLFGYLRVKSSELGPIRERCRLFFAGINPCWCHVPLQQHSASYCKSDRLWKASGTSQADQTTSPVSDQMSSLGRVQMVPASSEGKVRVTQWVKLDPSWNWLRLQVPSSTAPLSTAGIISIKAHAGWTRDYNRV